MGAGLAAEVARHPQQGKGEGGRPPGLVDLALGGQAPRAHGVRVRQATALVELLEHARQPPRPVVQGDHGPARLVGVHLHAGAIEQAAGASPASPSTFPDSWHTAMTFC